jgi:hypothetical protein
MNTGTTDQVRVKVHQMATRSVWVERTVIVEVPSDLIGDQTRIEEIIKNGEQDYGPFLWEPMNGSESLQMMDTAVGNQSEESPDISADPVNPLEHAEPKGESA